MSSFGLVALLLLLAAVFGYINHRTFQLPTVIGVLILAVVSSLALIIIDPWVRGYDLTGWARDALAAANLPHLLLDGVLAYLLFAGSLQVDIAALQRQQWAIFALSTFGTVAATVLFGFGIAEVFYRLGVDVPLPWCLVLGAILAPTDPVAIMALLQRTGLPEGLRMVIVGESLFNDGVGVVVFLIALGVAGGDSLHIGTGHALIQVIIQVGGGGLLGIATGWVAYRAMKTVDDYNLELTITLALVTVTYSLAQWLGVSGPIAVVVAGLLIGNHATEHAMSDKSRKTLVTFWSLVDELLNALLFLMIGLELLAVDTSWLLLLSVLIAIPLAVVVRLASIAVPLLVMRVNTVNRLRAMGVLTWGGLRGGISVALALALPQGDYRGALLTVCYGVVVFTIVVQGLTMPRIVKLLYSPQRVMMPRAKTEAETITSRRNPPPRDPSSDAPGTSVQTPPPSPISPGYNSDSS